MAIGTVSDTIELTAAASTTIKPTGVTDEWIIHNIYVDDGKSVSVEFGDGTNWIDVDTITESMLSYYFHVTYTDYIRLINNEGTTIYVGYDGVQIL